MQHRLHITLLQYPAAKGLQYLKDVQSPVRRNVSLTYFNGSAESNVGRITHFQPLKWNGCMADQSALLKAVPGTFDPWQAE